MHAAYPVSRVRRERHVFTIGFNDESQNRKVTTQVTFAWHKNQSTEVMKAKVCCLLFIVPCEHISLKKVTISDEG